MPEKASPAGGAPIEVLVTGGCGYVGSHVVRELSDAGYSAVIFDDMSEGHLEAVDRSCDFRLFQADLRDRAELESCFRQYRFQGVLHLAGVTLVDESMHDPEKYYGANLIGGLNLLALCQRFEVKHFVFASTSSVYGAPQVMPVPETHPRLPATPYGRTKMAFEDALESYREAHKLNYLALRYSNAAGAHPSGELGEDHHPETHLIPNALRAAAGQLPQITVYGRDYPTPDGTCIRDYIHVSDVAQAHVLALEHLIMGGASGALNISTGQGQSVQQVIRLCEEVTGRKIPVADQARRPGDVAALVADPSKAHQMLGFTPKRSDLRTIVADAWNWVSKHPHGYGS